MCSTADLNDYAKKLVIFSYREVGTLDLYFGGPRFKSRPS